MNKPQPAPHGDDPTPASAGVLFARTHDGLLVAKVGDHAFVMMPAANGRYHLASAWRLCRRWKNGHAPTFTVMAAL
jgi:hypothetical protein